MSRARTILLVDPDPASAAALGPALRRHGYHVQPARDGSRALQLAVLRSPDLVLLDDGTPLVSAPTVARILRSNPRTSAIPILRTGRGEPARPDEPFLRKPFDVDAVLAAVTRALADAEPGRAAPEAGLEGRLEHLPLVDVVQMLSTNRRTGRLLVVRDAPPGQAPSRAEIAFDEGRVVDAAAGVTVGEKALVRLLPARSGQFTFSPGPVTGPRRIARRTDALLLDGLRQADELAALAGRLPGATALLATTGAAPLATGPAVEEVRRLLAAPASIQDLLDGAVASDVQVLGAVLALLEAGELAAGDPPPRGDAPALLDPATAHALRARLLERRGTASPERGDREVVAKVLLVGAAGGVALGGLAAVRGFREVEGGAAPFGTAATVDLGALRLDVVVLPSDPALRPLWDLLSAGAACALVLAPAEANDAVMDLARSARFPVGICAAPAAAVDPPCGGAGPAWCYVGPEPLAALRALLGRAAGRAPASPA